MIARHLVLLLLFVGVLKASAEYELQYVLEDDYTSANFFANFTFQTSDYCGCSGAANFTTFQQAQQLGLVSAEPGQPVILRVDANGVFGASGRPTVSVGSNKNYNGGLIIGDFAHMPSGCGAWPAFWTSGPDWPMNGEIDIIEGVNLNTADITTLHTEPGCVITALDKSLMNGTVDTNNCSTIFPFNGCSVTGIPNSYGTPFNLAGGGVYATQWNATVAGFIKIWFWSRAQIPSDITSNSPNPTTWGQPYFYKSFGSACPSSYFGQHQIIVDTYLCGEYAGDSYLWTACSKLTGASTCNAWVQNNPQNFTETYWSINYIQVYQLQNVSIPMTSGSAPAAQPKSSVGFITLGLTALFLGSFDILKRTFLN